MIKPMYNKKSYYSGKYYNSQNTCVTSIGLNFMWLSISYSSKCKSCLLATLICL